jgi:cobalamin biosynthesis Mg chelatase CobN
MRRITAIAAAALLASPLAASADPTYLRCDFKDHQGSRPSKGAIDLILNEAQGTVETRVLGFDGYTDNAYFGGNTIEFDAVETGIPMVLDRTTRWVVAKGQNNVRVCLSIEVPAA